MKVKLVFKFITFIALLGTITNLTLTRRKLKRKTRFDPWNLNFWSSIANTLVDKLSDNSTRQMVENYSSLLDEREGIKRLFNENLFKICQSSLESNALNAELSFKFSFKLQKLRKQFPSYKEDNIKGELEEIKQRLEESREDKSRGDKSVEEVTEIIKEDLVSELIPKFIRLESEIKELVHRENQTKENICFGTLGNDLFLKENNDTFKKMHATMIELEETENLVELLFISPEKIRKDWLDKAFKHDPSKVSEIVIVTQLNSKPAKYLKLIFKIIKLLAPFGEIIGETGGFIIEVISDVLSGKSPYQAIFNKIIDILEKLTVKEIFKFVEKTIGTDVLKIVKFIAKGIKNFVETKRKLRKNKIETSFDKAKSKVTVLNEIYRKNIELIYSSNNSIWIYRMLDKLNQLNSKVEKKEISYYDEQFKALCKQNFYVCGKELGLEFIKQNFSNEKICPSDIFLAERTDVSVLKNSKFVLKKSNFTENLDLYLNYFFSLSETLILKAYVRYLTSQSRIRSNLANSIINSGYNQEGECSNIKEQIFVKRLKHSGKAIDLVVINKEFAYRCNVIQYTTCKSIKDFFKLDKLKNNLGRANSLKIEPDTSTKVPFEIINNINNRIQESEDSSGPMTKEKSLQELEQKLEPLVKLIDEVQPLPDIQKELAEEKGKFGHLKQKIMKNANPVQNYIENRIDIGELLKRKVCETAKKPFEAFSENEKLGMENLIKKQIQEKNFFFNEFNGKALFVGSIETLLEVQSIPDSDININILDCFLILYNLVPIELDSKLFDPSYRKKKIDIGLIMKYEKNPKDSNILNYYSSGNKSCIHHKLIKNEEGITGYRDYYEILQSNGDENLPTLEEIKKNYPEIVGFFTDLESRASTYKNFFKINMHENSMEYNIGSVLNKDAFKPTNKKKFDLSDEHVYYDNCHFTYQFGFVEIEGGENQAYSYQFSEQADEVGLPLLKINRVQGKQLAFQNRFYILVYSKSDDISEDNIKKKNGVYVTIPKKLAHFGYYQLRNKEEIKFSVNHGNLFGNFNQGDLRIEVFVKPFKGRKEEENKSVCEEDI